nr:hypothetical protein [Tanacetum cinerariifolium]
DCQAGGWWGSYKRPKEWVGGGRKVAGCGVIRPEPNIPLRANLGVLHNENKSDFEHETDESESGSESHHEENEEDEDDIEEVKDEFVKTSSNDSDNENETMITDKDEEMDYTTSQLYDDVDIRLNKPVYTYKGFVQEEGIDTIMTNVQQGNDNSKILQFIKDAHVTLSTVPQPSENLVTSSSYSSDLAVKFLNFLDIPHTDVEIVSLMDVYVHHEVLSQQTLTLFTVPVSVISDSSQSEEPEFEVVDSDMPQDQEENPSNDNEEPKEKVASKCDWFTKPTQPQEPTDPD